MWTRRQLLFGSAALALCPQMSFAKSPRAANNFVLVLLRGGLDGLAAVVLMAIPTTNVPAEP